nr:zinc finger, CCHC-type [Tanacetum cinerariifolium]
MRRSGKVDGTVPVSCRCTGVAVGKGRVLAGKLVKGLLGFWTWSSQSVSTYVVKMKTYLDHMERLGYPMPLILGVNLILTSLSKDYDKFLQDYNMHGMGKTIPELHAMLKLSEKSIPKKALAVLAIRQGQIQKPKSQARGKGKQRGKGKSKLAYDPKHKIPSPAKKEHPSKDTECHHCHNTGHWKRNYPLYLVELKKNKSSTSGTSSIFKIDYHFLKVILEFMTLIVALTFVIQSKGLEDIRS